MALVLFWKRRKAKKSKPSATSTTRDFGNPTYATSENPPEIKENFYSSCQFGNPAFEEPPEIQEDEYASLDDDQIYENVIRPVIAKYASLDDDQIYENVIRPVIAK